MVALQRLCLMLATIAVMVSLSALQASAQKFLMYGRVVCPDGVSVKTVQSDQMPVQKYQNLIVRVPGNLIEWFCNGRPQPAFVCPAGTNVVQVDNRQPGPVLTITCLRR